jgi:hypothetical protein
MKPKNSRQTSGDPENAPVITNEWVAEANRHANYAGPRLSIRQLRRPTIP